SCHRHGRLQVHRRASKYAKFALLWRRPATSKSSVEFAEAGMILGARFAKWGLGLFIFGVFLTFGIIGHYCGGARWPTREQFLRNITLWYACPWTLSVAAVQAGGLGMVALGVSQIAAASAVPRGMAVEGDSAALWLCIVGLLGVFVVGYPGYFLFDAIW